MPWAQTANMFLIEYFIRKYFHDFIDEKKKQLQNSFFREN